ncbi:MAG: Zn-dependent hydrolase [Gemmatimonas sp. SG8_38_2]|nr:MAG: Zn-dependent hydrolase [Gemmatimonas sp. SG8_38_2]
MLFERFYDRKLAQASYLIGCGVTGEAVVVDANRDVEQYVRAAESQGVKITHVTETHIHADFVSGTRELATRAGAKMYLSDEGDEDWKYAFAADAELLREGDSFTVGNVRIEALHTPGHTPEHLCFVVTDTAGADRPMGIFTGDCIFVGDVGRPDLLEKAAKVEGTMEASARQLYHSVQRFKDLPDYLQVWPAHGAGSACGRSLGAVPQSSLGYEKLFNWAFGEQTEDEFVRSVLADQPEPPKYFARMKTMNRDGPPLLGGFRRPWRFADARLTEVLDAGSLVIDTRLSTEYASAHVPGTISIPLNKSFPTYAGWLIPYDRDFYLIVEERDCDDLVDEAARDLKMIGLDRLAGYFGSKAAESWVNGGRRLSEVEEITLDGLAAGLDSGELSVIDVRDPGEWKWGHIPGAPNIPLGYLADRLKEVGSDKPIVIHCESGARSTIAASLLQANGFRNVLNFTGSLKDMQDAGLAVEG